MGPQKLRDGFHYPREPGEILSPDPRFRDHSEMAAYDDLGSICILVINPEDNRPCLEGPGPRLCYGLFRSLGPEGNGKNQKKDGAAEHVQLSMLVGLDARESRRHPRSGTSSRVISPLHGEESDFRCPPRAERWLSPV